MELENQIVEELKTYSTAQQIQVNSWGDNIEFTLYELKWTIDAILQHMGFYHKTENPCVMMRVLKIPVLDSSRSPALRGSSTLLGYPVVFS